MYEMAALVDALDQDIWKGNRINSTSAEAFLQELRQWSRQLPPEMRRFNCEGMAISNPGDRELLLGAVHVACNYYFAAILATRPFFTSHIMLKLYDQGQRSLDAERQNATPEERAKIASLAQVCLDAAKFMAKMTQRALDGGMLLNHMTVLV